MEFMLHLPQEINKDGPLWQTWNSFNKKCQLYQSTQLHGDSMGDSSSLLLLAGTHHINSICSSLKMYNLNLENLTKVLHAVEQVCLPYFILLFERFRYFSLKQELSCSYGDYSVVLQKQAEICEFINLKDITRTNVVYSSQQKTDSQDQSFSNADMVGYNEVDYNGAERSHGSMCDNNPLRFDGNLGLEMYDQSRSGSSSQVATISTPEELNSHSVGADSFPLTEKGKFDSVLIRKKNVGSKLTRMLSKWKVGEKDKLNRPGKNGDACFRNTDKELGVTSLQVHGWDGKVAASCTGEMGKDGNGASTPLISNIIDGENIYLKQFECCQCSRVFAGQNCFKKHLFTKHKGCCEFVCRVCEGKYEDAEKYVVHYTNAHTEEKKMHARAEEKKMQHARQRSTVKIKIKEVKTFQCTICSKIFHKKGYLNMHVHFCHKRSFLCWLCGEDLPSLLDYKLHSEKHVIIGRFLCDLCQKPYNSVFRLAGHLKNHLRPQNKCDICGRAFMRQESLAKHINKHIDEPAHMCKICGKIFVKNGRLQCHMKTHSGEKKFTCELCGKAYSQKVNLIYHKRWHTGEQPYECEICGKRTRSLGALDKHKGKHSDKYSYVCEICGRGFNYSSALLKHRAGHMGKRSYACDACGRAYIYRDGLRDHIKSSRCPGKAEDGVRRKPRASKLLLTGVPETVGAESKGFYQVPENVEADLKEVSDWPGISC